jgi:hypothetical protein
LLRAARLLERECSRVGGQRAGDYRADGLAASSWQRRHSQIVYVLAIHNAEVTCGVRPRDAEYLVHRARIITGRLQVGELAECG